MTGTTPENTPDGGNLAPQPLRQYALLADGERGVIVGPRGEYAWMCAPRWDSDAVFSTLVGGTGVYLVTPVGRCVWGGYYEEGTLIWRSRWVTDAGIVECREALAFPGDPHHAVLLRRIMPCRHPARMSVALEPCAAFGRYPLRGFTRRAPGVWAGHAGDLAVRWSGRFPEPRPADGGGRRLVTELTVEAGECLDLVLEIGDRRLPDRPPDPDALWRATEDAWHAAVPPLDGVVARTDARRAYTVLRGLTGSSGGMVASATTSLPERAEEGRNYDYRYVWIRDQCYAGQAVAAAGDTALLDDAVRFVTARLHEDGPRMAPAYTMDGRVIPDERELDLPGYPGGFDRVGNKVSGQFQLDAFGEALLLLGTAARLDRLDADGWRAAGIAADTIARRGDEPDAGVWELRPRRWAHSRLACAAGLRRAAGAAPGGRAAEWSALADRLVADTAAHCLHPSGRWQRSPEDPGLDGALLLPPLRGAVPADDPRTRATLRAYVAELTEDHYAYRFRHGDQPLEEAEGAFLLCGFVTALAEHQQGREVSAFRWFERNRAACGPAGLYAEEYDVAQHQLRGNLPQAFVHALMLECAARLAGPWADG
ncbi:glycoside hydrolase family 15 protein [Streptomyces mobaraensis]|uniref:Glycoside hydrolase family 15 protein n=1 Tax=Streptomyces mobaraensis TaxID=35621 RepID=A0A5N5W9N0_STRMB|nr:glycoside hydrolase family 15 protein [Streptomyces mobaraensis]KAB7847227.1 glycoside hydrolase family 15 protein [Streptomyces mobaraensis]